MHSTAVKSDQADPLDHKVIGALEKISQVLRFLAWKKATELAISPIQLQILVYLLRSAPEKGKVGLLASEFNISKASISDTIGLLEHKMLIEKSYVENGNRSFIIRLTNKGIQMARKADQMDAELLDAIAGIAPVGRAELFLRLGEILINLQRSSVIPIQRMCQTCVHYSSKDGRHHCGFLNEFMGTGQLQLDCPDHNPSAQLWAMYAC